MIEVPLLTILVAIAGPLGITLGWWLGRRSEREKASREERRNAYSAFIQTILEFRSADPQRRREIRGERWATFAVLTLVAPRHTIVQAAWALLSVQERLLDERDDAALKDIQDDVWKWASRYTELARNDLGLTDEPFGELAPATTRSGPPVLAADVLVRLDHDLAAEVTNAGRRRKPIA